MHQNTKIKNHRLRPLPSFSNSKSYIKQTSKLNSILAAQIYNKKQQTKQNYGINNDILYNRKENYLNAEFNRRKNKLLDITRENKHIYRRIISQKSFYSTREMNRSFDSNCSSSSKNSILKQLNKKNTLTNSSKSINSKIDKHTSLQWKSSLTIQSYNIQMINQESIDKFSQLFSNKNKQNQKISHIHQKRSKSKQQIYLPPIKGCSLLHNIQEQFNMGKVIKKKRIFL